MMHQEIIEAITDLGLTSLEAEVYVYLLQHSPATGYRIAKGTGRPFTTTYKILASLQDKGAILVDEGKSRLSRAVPLEELIDQLETRFRAHRERAREAAASLPQILADTRIYHLATVPQVYERLRAMLNEAKEYVLMELFPTPLETVCSEIEETARRGVDITVRAYRPVTLDGVRIVHSPFGEESISLFQSDWISVFVDGRQFLMGHLMKGESGVLQVVWSAAPLLAHSLYDYVNSDLHHYSFRACLESAETLDEARAEYARLQKVFPVGADLGTKDIVNRIRRDKESDRQLEE